MDGASNNQSLNSPRSNTSLMVYIQYKRAQPLETMRKKEAEETYASYIDLFFLSAFWVHAEWVPVSTVLRSSLSVPCCMQPACQVLPKQLHDSGCPGWLR